MTEMTVTYYLKGDQLDKLRELTERYNALQPENQTTPEDLFATVMHMSWDEIDARMQGWNLYLSRHKERGKREDQSSKS